VTSTAHGKILTLHRYFIWCNRMRWHFDRVLETRRRLPDEVLDAWGDPDGAVSSALYMSYWYGGLFVVVEGWRELDLHDAEIDELLGSPNVDLLRRYRNGVFHFQPSYHDDRFVDFYKTGGTPAWVRQLQEAFSRWFLAHFEARRAESGS
jgi:hypothetical protein